MTKAFVLVGPCQLIILTEPELQPVKSSLDNSDLFLTTSSFSSSSSEKSGEKPAKTEWWRLVGLEGGPLVDFLKRIQTKKRQD